MNKLLETTLLIEPLPAPPPNKMGWPWTAPDTVTPPALPAGQTWPRISLITPSYNQGTYLEETIRSVLLQGYPNLEYMVFDGGSTDDSLAIINQYAPWLTYWVSEPDEGQAHVLNKGFQRGTGQLFGWINSDDALLPNTLFRLAQAHLENPHSILLGNVLNVDEDQDYSWLGKAQNVQASTVAEPWHHAVFWQQPGLYFPAKLFRQVGHLDETFRYVFDWEWLCRALNLAPIYTLPNAAPLARFRYHQESKTVGEAERWLAEEAQLWRTYRPDVAAQNETFALAGWEMHQAEIYLRVYLWQRGQGVRHLLKAWQCSPSVLRQRRFWLLALKAALPVKTLHYLRRFYLKWLKTWLWH